MCSTVCLLQVVASLFFSSLHSLRLLFTHSASSVQVETTQYDIWMHVCVCVCVYDIITKDLP